MNHVKIKIHTARELMLKLSNLSVTVNTLIDELSKEITIMEDEE